MDLQELQQALQRVGVPVYIGYASTGAILPYLVVRPSLTYADSRNIAGTSLVWQDSFSAYACAESVEASFNLGRAVETQLDGARVAGFVIETSTGYVGTKVEGWYETQLTLQIQRGGTA